MIQEPTTHRPYPVTPHPWGDLSVATLRRGLLTRGTIRPDDVTRGPRHVTLLAVLDDGTFVVADAVPTPRHRTVRAMAA